MKKILLTSIGSFSTTAAVKSLKKIGYTVIGCDIYPKKYHYVSKEFEEVYKVSLAKNNYKYIEEILEICLKEGIKFIIPTTDVEIDIINKNRKVFMKNNIELYMQENKVLEIARDKYKIYEKFKNNELVSIIKTVLIDGIKDIDKIDGFPNIMKPRDGRSSEGIIRLDSKKDLINIHNLNNYISQKFILGDVYTVDYIRDKKNNCDFSIVRKELLRTKNGAGTTVKIEDNKKLISITSYIGNLLDVNGCICMEYIENNGKYYLIDINPRFSAGIAFSHKAGYDMVKNHINCFTGIKIDNPVKLNEVIITKHYVEDFILKA